MPSIDITRAHTGGSCRRIRITQVAARGLPAVGDEIVDNTSNPIYPLSPGTPSARTRVGGDSPAASPASISPRDGTPTDGQPRRRCVGSERTSGRSFTSSQEETAQPPQSPEPHPVGLPYAVKSRRTASNTPLMNDTDSSPENCRANSSASSITTAGGAPALVIS